MNSASGRHVLRITKHVLLSGKKDYTLGWVSVGVTRSSCTAECPSWSHGPGLFGCFP